MPLDPDYCRVAPDPRAPDRLFWMYEPDEQQPFGQLEVIRAPSQWGVKVLLSRLDHGVEDVLAIVKRALIQVIDCRADTVEVVFTQTGSRHQLVNVGSRVV
jgi:hypothetical protein